MNTTKLYPLAGEALQALGTHYRDALNKSIEATGIPALHFFRFMWTAPRMGDPATMSAAPLHSCNPYAPIQGFEQGLAEAAERGLLEQVAEGEYRLTGKGQSALQRVLEEGLCAPLAGLEPMPQADLERLTALLRRLVEATLAGPEPPGTRCIARSRRTDPGEDAPVLTRIDQYLTDLNRYRDDAHLASWQPHGVSGPAWEALSFLWEGQEMSALEERFENRGHPQGARQEALAELVGRGWAEQDGETYHVTEQGRAVRQEAEEATDRHFYGPWACLEKNETKELEDLLVRLRDGLAVAQD